MKESILIPLDGSKAGEAALPYVEELLSKLAPNVKVEIILLQVLSGTNPSIVGGAEGVVVPLTEEDMEYNRQEAVKYLSQFGESLTNKGAIVKTETRIGEASGEIVKIAQEIDADLIVMSTHGRSGLSRWAFGSVTEKVLRRGGNVPIVMVKAPREIEKA